MSDDELSTIITIMRSRIGVCRANNMCQLQDKFNEGKLSKMFTKYTFSLKVYIHILMESFQLNKLPRLPIYRIFTETRGVLLTQAIWLIKRFIIFCLKYGIICIVFNTGYNKKNECVLQSILNILLRLLYCQVSKISYEIIVIYYFLFVYDFIINQLPRSCPLPQLCPRGHGSPDIFPGGQQLTKVRAIYS